LTFKFDLPYGAGRSGCVEWLGVFQGLLEAI